MWSQTEKYSWEYNTVLSTLVLVYRSDWLFQFLSQHRRAACWSFKASFIKQLTASVNNHPDWQIKPSASFGAVINKRETSAAIRWGKRQISLNKGRLVGVYTAIQEILTHINANYFLCLESMILSLIYLLVHLTKRNKYNWSLPLS